MAVATLGILGGVFDPPHVGHVALAQAAIAELGLERLLVLVVADPGHKRATTPASTRLELARLAFEEIPDAEVELDHHARTVDSLEARRAEGAVFVLGADELADFPGWKSPERVLELVCLAVAMRPGVSADSVRETRARLSAPERVSFFELEPVAVSSSLVRERVAQGEPIDDLVSRSVAEAIARLGLYAPAE
ncbi:MAG: nicotinate-nicotinamide nucleotide adenylyltransferase [Actinobacteria bacterium]|nr:nicotinate-nicotinamide nucleotide adenylyltransferase [Actinomycetota bacterium]